MLDAKSKIQLFFPVPLPDIDDCVNHTCANGG